VKKYFSERYHELIQEENFIPDLPHKVKMKLIKHLNTFDEPFLRQYGRYDGYSLNSSAKSEALEIYCEIQGWTLDNLSGLYDEWLYKMEVHEFFDIIEIWSHVLSPDEQLPFQKDFNIVMEEFDIPWRLFDGKLFKIDSQQFEHDLRNKALIEMEELSAIVPEFRNSYLEFLEACDNLTNNDYEYAILNACKSFESVLKVVLNVNRGTADVLTKAYIESEFMNALPVDVKKTGFQEKVLMSLPYLRNNIAGHGDGKESYTVPESLAKLSVNLASSLNTYIVEQYRAHILKGKPEIQESEQEEEIPF